MKSLLIVKLRAPRGLPVREPHYIVQVSFNCLTHSPEKLKQNHVKFRGHSMLNANVTTFPDAGTEPEKHEDMTIGVPQHRGRP